MKRIVFKKKHVLEWENVPEPKIQVVNQAIVKPITVSRCDLDLPIVNGYTLFRPGIPIGHEFVGTIEETSLEIANQYPKGTKVIIPFQISCGILSGLYNRTFQGLHFDPLRESLRNGTFRKRIRRSLVRKNLDSIVLYLDNDSERLKIAENLGAIAVPYSILPKAWERKFPLITN
ncbi:alcohol dehydrogenase catalytic domain-containing protein [Leptospira kirschneri]|uniref:alcohol dehydrogenase catalytic domain-containing protein n=1 Tax=Leptospira kirschneri TaxID=29507 RepID=UPI000278532F|nr:alcohol dehydrogenase catalytic domain-containing protein [Leptospira kirschneri]EJO71085.1 alcohol dehydrogenase, catalytic domain, GroES-like family [Leptospira kirschneri serovar Grippotyphosa str. RM52]EKR07063.1 alcohol dehydrogenase, catalytic domain protein, GroES-like family [Leptospira kirschneri serovar Valbuzzi str. 200702274]KON79015.1 Alcohol dehydrogenase, catalytic domain, GroES-like family [Leptospira kirschneri serovar Mozdok]KPZ76300.1 molecular chaperone GroES [Leptospira 